MNCNLYNTVWQIEQTKYFLNIILLTSWSCCSGWCRALKEKKALNYDSMRRSRLLVDDVDDVDDVVFDVLLVVDVEPERINSVFYTLFQTYTNLYYL
jgi:hypothetical protein